MRAPIDVYDENGRRYGLDVAVSGLQKAVRRCEPDQAVAAANLIADAHYSGAIESRLRVIASEDVNIADSTAALFVDTCIQNFEEASKVAKKVAAQKALEAAKSNSSSAIAPIAATPGTRKKRPMEERPSVIVAKDPKCRAWLLAACQEIASLSTHKTRLGDTSIFMMETGGMTFFSTSRTLPGMTQAVILSVMAKRLALAIGARTPDVFFNCAGAYYILDRTLDVISELERNCGTSDQGQILCKLCALYRRRLAECKDGSEIRLLYMHCILQYCLGHLAPTSLDTYKNHMAAITAAIGADPAAYVEHTRQEFVFDVRDHPWVLDKHTNAGRALKRGFDHFFKEAALLAPESLVPAIQQADNWSETTIKYFCDTKANEHYDIVASKKNYLEWFDALPKAYVAAPLSTISDPIDPSAAAAVSSCSTTTTSSFLTSAETPAATSTIPANRGRKRAADDSDDLLSLLDAPTAGFAEVAKANPLTVDRRTARTNAIQRGKLQSKRRKCNDDDAAIPEKWQETAIQAIKRGDCEVYKTFWNNTEYKQVVLWLPVESPPKATTSVSSALAPLPPPIVPVPAPVRATTANSAPLLVLPPAPTAVATTPVKAVVAKLPTSPGPVATPSPVTPASIPPPTPHKMPPLAAKSTPPSPSRPIPRKSVPPAPIPAPPPPAPTPVPTLLADEDADLLNGLDVLAPGSQPTPAIIANIPAPVPDSDNEKSEDEDEDKDGDDADADRNDDVDVGGKPEDKAVPPDSPTQPFADNDGGADSNNS